MFDFNSLEGRKTAVLQIQRMAMKARSDMTEALGDDEVAQRILHELHPYLFGELNLVYVSTLLIESGEFSNSDIMNLLVLCHKEPALLLLHALWFDGDDLIEPMEFIRTTTLFII